MKKFFSFFAALLFAGSMMAADPVVLTFVEGTSTTGDVSTKYTADPTAIFATNSSFISSVSLSNAYPARVGCGTKLGTSSASGFLTLNLATPAEFDSIVVSAAAYSATQGDLIINDGEAIDLTSVGNKVFANYKITPEGTVSSLKVASGSTFRNYINKITFYPKEGTTTGGGTNNEEEEIVLGELLSTLDFPSHNDAEISSYVDTWTATVNGETWTLTNFNNNKNVWNMVKCGRKSVASVASIETPALKATVNTLIYDFAALPANSVDSAFIYALYQGEEQGKASVTLKAGKDTIAVPVAGVKYSYKLEIYCKSASSNGPVQLSSVQVYGTPAQSAVADPVFDIAAGDFYDPQTIHLTCATEGAVMLYTTDGTDPVLGSAAVYYPLQGIYVGESVTIKAIAYNNDSDNPQFSDVVEKTYTIAPVYNSFDELVNQAGAPTTVGYKVVVNFENVVIDSLYTTKAGKVNGVYLTAAGRMVEIYCYDVPATWAVGGTISGTVKGEWKDYNGTWEVAPSSWQGITYQAPVNVTVTVDAAAMTYTVEGTDEGSYYFLMAGSTTYGEEDFASMFAANASYMEPGYGPAEWCEEGEMGVFTGNGTFSLSALGFNEETPAGEYRFAFQLVAMGATEGVLVGNPVFVVFTLPSTPTGLDNVEAAEAVKFIEDGQVIIIREGVRYNVAGQKL